MPPQLIPFHGPGGVAPPLVSGTAPGLEIVDRSAGVIATANAASTPGHVRAPRLRAGEPYTLVFQADQLRVGGLGRRPASGYQLRVRWVAEQDDDDALHPSLDIVLDAVPVPAAAARAEYRGVVTGEAVTTLYTILHAILLERAAIAAAAPGVAVAPDAVLTAWRVLEVSGADGLIHREERWYPVEPRAVRVI